MTHYVVTWTIDIEATDPVSAASEALAIQRDPESIATVFVVTTQDEPGVSTTVDMGEGVEVRLP